MLQLKCTIFGCGSPRPPPSSFPTILTLYRRFNDKSFPWKPVCWQDNFLKLAILMHLSMLLRIAILSSCKCASKLVCQRNVVTLLPQCKAYIMRSYLRRAFIHTPVHVNVKPCSERPTQLNSTRVVRALWTLLQHVQLDWKT